MSQPHKDAIAANCQGESKGEYKEVKFKEVTITLKLKLKKGEIVINRNSVYTQEFEVISTTTGEKRTVDVLDFEVVDEEFD